MYSGHSGGHFFQAACSVTSSLTLAYIKTPHLDKTMQCCSLECTATDYPHSARYQTTAPQLLYKQSQSIFTPQQNMSLEPTCWYIWTSFTGCLKGAHAWTFKLFTSQEGRKSSSYLVGHLELLIFSQDVQAVMCSFRIITYKQVHAFKHTGTHTHTHTNWVLHRAINIEKIKCFGGEAERDGRPLQHSSQQRESRGESKRERWRRNNVGLVAEGRR